MRKMRARVHQTSFPRCHSWAIVAEEGGPNVSKHTIAYNALRVMGNSPPMRIIHKSGIKRIRSSVYTRVCVCVLCMHMGVE